MQKQLRVLIRSARKLLPRSNTDLYKTISEKTVDFDVYSLTPHEYHITQQKNMERPFTGRLWDAMDVGHYECMICDNRIFE